MDDMIKIAQKTKLKDFYTAEYPTDDLGEEINESATFYGLFETLDYHLDIYDYIGVGDSLVRERLFDKLAEIMQVDYDYIYRQWIA